MSDGLISFYVAQQNVREHSFSVDVVIDAQYTKTSAGRILPQIPVLETKIEKLSRTKNIEIAFGEMNWFRINDIADHHFIQIRTTR